MNEPVWAEAPEWAEWCAQDQNGRWYWYEHEPVRKLNQFAPSKGRWREAIANKWHPVLNQRGIE